MMRVSKLSFWRTGAGEDFSAYQHQAPGVFFFLGAGNRAKGLVRPHHPGRFEIDEDCLPLGAAAMVATAEGLLRVPAPS